MKLNRIGSLALAAVLSFALVTQLACNTPDLVKNARRVSTALKAVVPIFSANGIGTMRLAVAIDIADRLITAFETNNNAAALELTSALITEFNALVSQDVVRITNPATRTIVLVGLAVANIALHQISDALAEQPAGVLRRADPSSAQKVQTIVAFGQRKNWRCRNASSGKFAPMSFCKQFPANSVVETY